MFEGAAADERGGGRLRIRFTQRLEGVALDETDFEYDFSEVLPRPSTAATPDSDWVILKDYLEPREARVVVQTSREDECDSQSFLGEAKVPLGPLEEGPDCQAEIAIFSSEHAARRRDRGIRPHPGRQTYTVRGRKPIQVPLDVWVDTTAPNESAIEEEAYCQVARANVLLRCNRAGLQIQPRRKSLSPEVAAQLMERGCDYVRQAGVLHHNTIAALFLGGKGTPTCCARAPSATLIPRNAIDGALAHELGHSFNLDHTCSSEGNPDPSNVMTPKKYRRSKLTAGQAYRMLFSRHSTLQSVGIAPDSFNKQCPLERLCDCACDLDDEGCIDVDLEWP
jgi:hypothetical protein